MIGKTKGAEKATSNHCLLHIRFYTDFCPVKNWLELLLRLGSWSPVWKPNQKIYFHDINLVIFPSYEFSIKVGFAVFPIFSSIYKYDPIFSHVKFILSKNKRILTNENSDVCIHLHWFIRLECIDVTNSVSVEPLISERKLKFIHFFL